MQALTPLPPPPPRPPPPPPVRPGPATMQPGQLNCRSHDGGCRGPLHAWAIPQSCCCAVLKTNIERCLRQTYPFIMVMWLGRVEKICSWAKCAGVHGVKHKQSESTLQLRHSIAQHSAPEPKLKLHHIYPHHHPLYLLGTQTPPADIKTQAGNPLTLFASLPCL